MQRHLCVLFALFAVVTAGCGAGATSEPAMQPVMVSTEGGEVYGGGGSAEESGGYAPQSPSAPQPSVVQREAEVDPRLRPGLATQWGEARQSAVHMTQFVRANPENPLATAVLHYNDAQGAAAQVALRGGPGNAHIGIGGSQYRVLVTLVDEYGQPLPMYRMGNQSYVVGEPGRRYSVRLENQSPWRFEGVVSVDGLDVIDGREASFQKRGYIIRPGQTMLIEGFRTSESEVAAFRFGSVANSYANQTTGSARNVGVVGVALFAEAGVAVDLYGEAVRREQADPFPGRYAAPPPVPMAY
jgi:hypothetical protein